MRIQAKGLATEGVAVAESQGLAAESDSEHELQHDADYEDDEFEPVQETEIQVFHRVFTISLREPDHDKQQHLVVV